MGGRDIGAPAKVMMVSLGCPKNTVDSENMLGLLAQAGHPVVASEDEADVILINTCSFIGDASRESVQTILQLAQHQRRLIVTGCLAQRHQQELLDSLPEVSAIVGTADFNQIVAVVERVSSGERFNAVKPFSKDDATAIELELPRLLTGLGPSAYLKIAEGCDHSCSFCAIPSVRGGYVSRPKPAILAEARHLVAAGVKELVLVAEDTTRYGQKETGQFRLGALLEDLAAIPEIDWIRILYAYPNYLNDELLAAIRDLPKVVKYLDVPLQHTHPEILTAMRRPRHEPPAELIVRLRDQIPGLVLRTTLIMGFPGETQEHVDQVLEFLDSMRIDHVGAFAFSPEAGTRAAHMKPVVPKRVRQHRRRQVLETQQRVSHRIHQELVGQVLPFLCEARNVKTGVAIGRTYRDAPEIDGTTYVAAPNDIEPGDLVPIRIASSGPYDLHGETLLS